jgi:ribosomal protein L14E/L6E/L27E
MSTDNMNSGQIGHMQAGEMQIGQIVFSKKGRDKGRAMVIISVEGEYVFLADGQLRPLNKPKKKKARHIQPTRTIIDEVNAISTVNNGLQTAAAGGLTDADIRKWLRSFGR